MHDARTPHVSLGASLLLAFCCMPPVSQAPSQPPLPSYPVHTFPRFDRTLITACPFCRCTQALTADGKLQVDSVILPDGEAFKSMEVLQVHNELQEEGLQEGRLQFYRGAYI